VIGQVDTVADAAFDPATKHLLNSVGDADVKLSLFAQRVKKT
jgi:hypothetical protein